MPCGTPLADALRDAACRWPDRLAVVDGDRRISFADLDAEASRVAWMLRAFDVRDGERVAMVLPTSWLFPVVMFGILRAGAICVPMNPLATRTEVELQATDADVVLAIVHDEALLARVGAGQDHKDAGALVLHVGDLGAVPWAGHAADYLEGATDPHKTAVILYTSGSTGLPKGVPLTLANLAAASEAHRDPLQLNQDEPDVLLAAVPLAHVFGLSSVLLPWLLCGGTLVTMRRFDAIEAVDRMRRESVTYLAAVPTMLSRLLDVDAQLGLRVVLAGGAVLPDEMLEPLRSRLGGRVIRGYGMTEASGPVCLNAEPGAPTASVGRTVRGVEARIVDSDDINVAPGSVGSGEIQIRGATLFRGYWRRPETEDIDAASGSDWFRTGDLGRLDDDGYLYLTGRLKDVIIRGGYKIHPVEVERVLMMHPAVRSAAVVGREHPSLGQEVHAFVVTDPDTPVQNLVDFARQRLAAYKVPRKIMALDELPRNGLGKVLKDELP